MTPAIKPTTGQLGDARGGSLAGSLSPGRARMPGRPRGTRLGVVLTEGLIIAAVAVGAHALLVNPARLELAALVADDQLAREHVLDPRGTPALGAAYLRSQAAQGLLAIEQRSAVATDASLLTSRLEQLAERHGLIAAVLIPRPIHDLTDGDATAIEVGLRTRVTVEGAYDAVAAYLSALQREVGFATVPWASVTPVGAAASARVRAVAEVEARGVRMPATQSGRRDDRDDLSAHGGTP